MSVAFVRESGSAVGTTSPLAVTITGAAAGNTLIAYVASNRGSTPAQTVTSITSTNTTWSLITGAKTSNGVLGLEIWKGIVAGGTSGTAVSITMSGTVASGVCADVLEFSSVANPAVVDATAVLATGTSVTPATGAYTTVLQDDLLLAAFAEPALTTPTASPSGSWSNGTFKGGTSCGVQGSYQAPTPAKGLQTAASWTIASLAWATVIVALQGLALPASVTRRGYQVNQGVKRASFY